MIEVATFMCIPFDHLTIFGDFPGKNPATVENEEDDHRDARKSDRLERLARFSRG
jgi:hypothetical protein